MKVKFVCLANSIKLSGRCVAGLRIEEGGVWFRPVCESPGGTLFSQHYTLDDGRDASLLDIIEVEVTRQQPEPYQPENWVLSNNQHWKLVARISFGDAYVLLMPSLNNDPNILGNPFDHIPYIDDATHTIPASLVLIEPNNVRWYIQYYGTKRKTRVLFRLGEFNYNLSITDPVWKQRLSELSEGVHPKEAANIGLKDNLIFTVSLSLPFNGNCYKLVAGVICLPRI
jgi:hypothetical protein